MSEGDALSRLRNLRGDVPVSTPDPLHGLEAWGARLDSLISDPDWRPDQFDALVFRPCVESRDALDKLSVRYPHVIGHVREFLDYAEWAYTDLCRSLLPVGCAACGSDEDFEECDGDRIRCFICGEVTNRPASDTDAIEESASAVATAFEALSRRIRSAVKVIGEAESPSTPAASFAKPKRKPKKSGPTAQQRQNVAAIIAEFGRTTPDKRIAWHLSDRKQGMRKATRLAILRELKADGKWAG